MNLRLTTYCSENFALDFFVCGFFLLRSKKSEISSAFLMYILELLLEEMDFPQRRVHDLWGTSSTENFCVSTGAVNNRAVDTLLSPAQSTEVNQGVVDKSPLLAPGFARAPCCRRSRSLALSLPSSLTVTPFLPRPLCLPIFRLPLVISSVLGVFGIGLMRRV